MMTGGQASPGVPGCCARLQGPSSPWLLLGMQQGGVYLLGCACVTGQGLQETYRRAPLRTVILGIKSEGFQTSLSLLEGLGKGEGTLREEE